MQQMDNLADKSKEELITLINSMASSFSDKIHQQEKTIKQQSSFIDILQQELSLAKQRHYGRKSEKNIADAYQHNLFDEASLPPNTKEIENVDEAITVASHKRKKSGKRPLPKELPRIRVIHDLPAEDKKCPCGCMLTKIGEESSEQLDIIPAKIQVIKHVKYKYACKSCEDTIKTASMPKQPIPKSIATAGLLAHVLVSKYKDHLPLYRQEQIFQRMRVDIARNTLSHWVIKCAELLLPLHELLQQNIVNYDIAYADETRVQVLKEPGKLPESQSYMWCFIGGAPDSRSVIYHYDPGRAHTVLEKILEGFNGHLHCDGFVGYDTFASDHEVKLLGCWMHARRKYAQIIKNTKTAGLSHEAINIIGNLYKIEKYIKDNNFTVAQTYEYRLANSKPILDKFKSWLDSNVAEVLPQSPIGKAINYSLNQWSQLITYLDDGRLEIDNGLTERTIKPFVIGRKNWLFNNSVAGAKSSAIIYSIIETCNIHEVEPYAYLRYVLQKLPSVTTLEELQDLLPFAINRELLTI